MKLSTTEGHAGEEDARGWIQLRLQSTVASGIGTWDDSFRCDLGTSVFVFKDANLELRLYTLGFDVRRGDQLLRWLYLDVRLRGCTLREFHNGVLRKETVPLTILSDGRADRIDLPWFLYSGVLAALQPVCRLLR